VCDRLFVAHGFAYDMVTPSVVVTMRHVQRQKAHAGAGHFPVVGDVPELLVAYLAIEPGTVVHVWPKTFGHYTGRVAGELRFPQAIAVPVGSCLVASPAPWAAPSFTRATRPRCRAGKRGGARPQRRDGGGMAVTRELCMEVAVEAPASPSAAIAAVAMAAVTAASGRVAACVRLVAMPSADRAGAGRCQAAPDDCRHGTAGECLADHGRSGGGTGRVNHDKMGAGGG